MAQPDVAVLTATDAITKPSIFLVTGPAALVAMTVLFAIGIGTFVAEELDDDGRLRLLQLEGRKTDNEWEPAKRLTIYSIDY